MGQVLKNEHSRKFEKVQNCREIQKNVKWKEKWHQIKLLTIGSLDNEIRLSET